MQLKLGCKVLMAGGVVAKVTSISGRDEQVIVRYDESGQPSGWLPQACVVAVLSEPACETGERVAS